LRLSRPVIIVLAVGSLAGSFERIGAARTSI